MRRTELGWRSREGRHVVELKIVNPEADTYTKLPTLPRDHQFVRPIINSSDKNMISSDEMFFRRKCLQIRPSRVIGMMTPCRIAAKSGRAGEWDGWGRLSEDGLGQNNPDRSEDPWGAGCLRPDRFCGVGVGRLSQTQSWQERAVPRHEGW